MIEVNETGACSPLPQYECHKVVSALKLEDVSVQDGKVAIQPAKGQGFAAFYVEIEWASRYKPEGDDKGYYVVYADGYKSWSPTKAFEEGYTKK